MRRWMDSGNPVSQFPGFRIAKFGMAGLGMALALQACQPSPDTLLESRANRVRADPNRNLTVYTVNYPLAWFAKEIGGQDIDVVFPAPPDADPAYWFPDPEIIGRYQQADLILLNSANYAAWVQQATLPSARLIDTSNSFGDSLIIIENSSTHTHGPEGEHAHRGTAFTTWLDPGLAAKQAQSIRNALAQLRPDLRKDFDAGFNTLAANLDELDQEFQAVFNRIGDQPVLFSHPVYQYLIRRYGINARSLHWEPDAYLMESDLAELAEILETHPATVMLWESEPVDTVRETLGSRGVSSIVFSPAANTPMNGDYLSVMRNNLTNLQSAL